MKGLALTRALVREAIENQISFVNATIPTSLSMTQKQLRVLISTRHRHNGDPMTLQAGWNFPREGISTREHAISWVVACVRETWVHELHEAIFVNGTRRNDLHVPGTVSIRQPPQDLVDPWTWKAVPQGHVPRKDAPKRRTGTRSVAATMRAVKLPDGWTWEPASFNPSTRVVVKAPNGEATINFAERCFDLVENAPAVSYAGRNWRGALVADAIEALRVRVPQSRA